MYREIMTLREVVEVIKAEGPPYVATCHVTEGVYLADHNDNGEFEVNIYVKLKLSELKTIYEYFDLLWFDWVAESDFFYYDVWRPIYSNDKKKPRDIEYLKKLGFISDSFFDA